MKETIFGLHAVSALLDNHPTRIIRLCVDKNRRDDKIEDMVRTAKKQGISIEHHDKKSLDKLSEEGNHQGVLAFCKQAKAKSDTELMHLLDQLTVPPFLLILDGVQDPHNLGACFRTADAFGVHAIIVPKDNAVGLTGVVSKVACGATETVPFFQVTNLSRTMEALKERGIWLYGADGEADKSVDKIDLKGAIGIVMGAEGTGLRRLTRDRCDDLMTIPMVGTVESLNVSVATGVLLFLAARGRK